VEDEDGMAKTAAVLQEMKRSDVRAMLDEIEKVDPERAQQLRSMVNTFDTLLLANDRGIQELLRAVETKTLCVALHEEDPAMLTKFLDNLSERAAAMMKEEMEYLSEVRPAEKKEAQNEIMAAALELEKEDKLLFQEPSGGDE
jgi:flagellar motor switch protein FliG